MGKWFNTNTEREGIVMDIEGRRIVDGELTQDFLRNNQVLVQMLIGEFGTQINAAGLTPANNYRFYLKGGNALAILTNRVPDGDYDFQLRPPDAVYANWAAAFPALDVALLTALENTVINTQIRAANAGLAFNVTSFLPATIQAWAATANNPVHENHIDVANLVQQARRNDILEIGTNFRNSSYRQIVTDPNFHNGRLEGHGVVAFAAQALAGLAGNFGPMIYVNYTIPGFILYRMVLSYQYSDNDGNFNLKSEIIDVSVPRPGSGEVFMAQSGVVTHFRPTGNLNFPFEIPGWGYHLYENINLLQEIELGISGSPHKRAKRERRLLEAYNAMTTANGAVGRVDTILPPQINEPQHNNTFGPPFQQISGYFGILSYNVKHYNAFEQNATAYLQAHIAANLKQHFIISEEAWGRSRTQWQKLVYYRLSRAFDKKVVTVEAARSAVAKLLCSYRSAYASYDGGRLDMRENITFQYISPFSRLENGDLLPCDYVVAQVVTEVYRELNRFYINRDRYMAHGLVPPLPAPQVPPAFSCIAVCEGASGGAKFFIVFQNCGQALPLWNNHLEEVLANTILESQRYALTKYLQRP